MRIASAGMAGPVHISASGGRVLELSGIPPGLFSFAEYSSVTIPLEAADSVLFFTDGISDAFDSRGEQFGMERLRRVCSDNRSAPPGELLKRVFTAVDRFSGGREPEDDMAATVFHYEG